MIIAGEPAGAQSMNKRNFVKEFLGYLFVKPILILFKRRKEESLKSKVLKMHISETTDSGRHK